MKMPTAALDRLRDALVPILCVLCILSAIAMFIRTDNDEKSLELRQTEALERIADRLDKLEIQAEEVK
jgi:hypothetical protein